MSSTPQQLHSAILAAAAGTDEVTPFSVHCLSMERIGLSQSLSLCVCVKSVCVHGHFVCPGCVPVCGPCVSTSLCDCDVCVARDIHTNDHKQTWSKSRHITLDIHKDSRHALSTKACMFPGHALIIHTEQFIEEKKTETLS